MWKFDKKTWINFDRLIKSFRIDFTITYASSLSSRLKSGKEIASSVFVFSPIQYINETLAISKNFSRRSFFFLTISSFLLFFFLRFSEEQVKGKKKGSMIFLYIISRTPRGGVSSS